MNKGDNMNNFIGIFDSGIGGLSVLESIRELLPHENILYLADEKKAFEELGFKWFFDMD